MYDNDYLSSLSPFWQSFYTKRPEFTWIGQHSWLPESAQATTLNALHMLSTLSVSGKDAASFLQGQLVTHIDNLLVGDSALSAHCNSKGRANSTFFLYRQSEDQFLLILHHSIAEFACKALSKYAVFSKVDVCIEAHWCWFGALANTSTDTIDTKKCIVIDCLDLQLYGFQTENAEAFTATEVSGSGEWFWECLQQGIPLIEENSIESFIPQMLNFDLLDSISFDKGCYTGQEIIARIKYLGSAKRRCSLYTLDSINKAIPQSLAVFNDKGAQVGDLITSVVNPDGKALLLVCMQTRSLDNADDLQLAQITEKSEFTAYFKQNLSPSPLPYAINN